MANPKRPMLGDHGRGQGVGQDRVHQRPAGEGRSPADRRQDDLHVPEGTGSGRRAARRSPTRNSPPPKPLLAQVGTKITLPVDYLAAKSDDLNATQVFEGADPRRVTRAWTSGRRRSRSTPTKIKKAGTVIWNGPVGWFEQPAFSNGHEGHRRGDGGESGAITVVGGGETAEAVEQFGFDDEDDARLDRRRRVPRLRRGEEVPEPGADRRQVSGVHSERSPSLDSA